MKWFRIFLVAAVICAVVAIGVWGIYGLIGSPMGDGAEAFALAAAFLALILGGAAGVSAATRSNR